MLDNEVKKVLLFIPPAFTQLDNIDINPIPPLGLAYLGAILEQNAIEVKIVDCLMEGWNNRARIDDNLIRIGLSWEQIEKIIRDYSPDIVGVNSLFTRQRLNAHEICRLAKKVDKKIITTVGGAHPTVLPEAVLADENVDYISIGEGEETIMDIVRLVEGRNLEHELDGIGFRTNNQIVIIPKTRFINNLDELPFPAWHLANLEHYFGLEASHGTRKKKRFAPIITSRGCPAKCTFCSANKVWGRRYRYRSPENVIKEMKYLKNHYGIEEIMFEDDNVTLNVKRAEQIFDLMIEEKFDFVWDTPNGAAAYALNERLIVKMKASGCYQLNLALETGNQYVMDNIIKKPLKLERAKQVVEYARSIDLDLGLFFVIGMPGETKEQMWDSFRLARELGVYTPHISIATPYPGTELYNICVENNYITDKFSLDDLFIRSFCISTKEWNGEDLQKILSEGQRFLLSSRIKDHPFEFVKFVLSRIVSNPKYYLGPTYIRNVINKYIS